MSLSSKEEEGSGTFKTLVPLFFEGNTLNIYGSCLRAVKVSRLSSLTLAMDNPPSFFLSFSFLKKMNFQLVICVMVMDVYPKKLCHHE